MSRRSLRPQLNQIRGWVRQGRTDAWIAHQLEVTVQQIQAFKREHGLEPDGDGAARDRRRGGRPARRGRRGDRRRARGRGGAPRRGGGQGRRGGRAQGGRGRRPPSRGRGARGEAEADARALARPRTRKRTAGPLEGTFDHGEEGYGLWLDPAVAGRPRLRRALGRPPARRGHDRGGPDRDPPRRRRRGRRRLTSTASSRTCARSRTRSRERTEPLPWGTAVFHRGVPWVREVNVVRVEATARGARRATSRSRPSRALPGRARGRGPARADRRRRRARASPPPAGRSAATC